MFLLELQKRYRMLNEITYTKIRQARASHARWVRRAKHLIEGLPISEDMIPIDSTSCEFGMWFYHEGMKFKSNPELLKYLNSIEEKHNHLHDIYLKIYKIYFVDTRVSWYRSILTNKHREVSPNECAYAKVYFDSLEKVSEELLALLEKLEIQLRALTLNNIYYG
jgi:hypothetical protein